MARPTSYCYLIAPHGLLVRWTGKRLLFAKAAAPELRAYLRGDEALFPPAQEEFPGEVHGTVAGRARAICSDADLLNALHHAARLGVEGMIAVERLPHFPGAARWRP